MIDLDRESLIPLTEAAKLFPRRRAGAKPHLSTLWRYCLQGYHGIKLEHVRVGATLCTSEAAVRRFMLAMTNGQPAPAGPSPEQREREIAAAEKRLAAAGL